MRKVTQISKRIAISPHLVRKLRWWMRREHLEMVIPFRHLQPSICIITEESKADRGAHYLQNKINTTWSLQERAYHINFLELCSNIQSNEGIWKYFSWQSCLNTASMYCGNKKGGIKSMSLIYQSARLWEWCVLKQIFPIAIYVTGGKKIR